MLFVTGNRALRLIIQPQHQKVAHAREIRRDNAGFRTGADGGRNIVEAAQVTAVDQAVHIQVRAACQGRKYQQYGERRDTGSAPACPFAARSGRPGSCLSPAPACAFAPPGRADDARAVPCCFCASCCPACSPAHEGPAARPAAPGPLPFRAGAGDIDLTVLLRSAHWSFLRNTARANPRRQGGIPRPRACPGLKPCNGKAEPLDGGAVQVRQRHAWRAWTAPPSRGSAFPLHGSRPGASP